MRTVPPAWIPVETARERQVALLIHIFARRDGRVTLPNGWGSWTYSVGFRDNVNFTDLANYASDGIQSRTYVPAAIEFDSNQVFRKESTDLDPHDITLTVDPSLDPFLNYVNHQWPLTFGIVIYKVHRNGAGIVTVDNGSGVQVPVVDVAFIGYLDSDDTFDTNSAGLEQTIDGGKLKLTTKWDHITKKFVRQVPRPVFSIDCPKALFSSSGTAAVDCNADPQYVRIDGFVLQVNGVLISAVEWAAQPTGWFAQGLIQYTATDPISGLDFGFALNVTASAQRTDLGVTYGDLTLEMFPPLPIEGLVVTAFGGCDRVRSTCIGKHIPVGTVPPAPGTPTPGHIEFALQLFNSVSGNAKTARVMITPTQLTVEYSGTDTTQIGNFAVNGADWTATSMVALGSNSLVTSPGFALTAGGSGPPNAAGYNFTLTNNGAGAPSIDQKPTAANGFTTIIKMKGQAAYDFTVSWSPTSGSPVNFGNLENFGGTDIPIEHPTLETTQG
jgi:hypothetical protein